MDQEQLGVGPPIPLTLDLPLAEIGVAPTLYGEPLQSGNSEGQNIQVELVLIDASRGLSRWETRRFGGETFAPMVPERVGAGVYEVRYRNLWATDGLWPLNADADLGCIEVR